MDCIFNHCSLDFDMNYLWTCIGVDFNYDDHDLFPGGAGVFLTLLLF